MSTLRAEGIQKRFSAVEVIRGVSLSFAPSTVTAIVGDNGAGKSTFLKILAGIHRADSGQVQLGTHVLSGDSPAEHRRRGIEMVFQDLALAKSHDVAANLFLGRELIGPLGLLKRGAMREQAHSILQQLGIQITNLNAAIGTLSGGQQQAVAIARALLFNPQVLLLDEPTAALAAREVERVLNLIRQQKAQGRTIILVSHRLNDVFAVADRIVVLKRGQVFSDDPSAKLTLAEVVQRIVS